MKTAERIVVVVLLIILFGGAGWIYVAVQHSHQEKLDAVARGEFEIRDESAPVSSDWRDVYPNTIPARIGSTSVQVSVADTIAERIKGLSGTPFLPEDVVKLFIFGAAGGHSIWMKDMNYAIDILWLDEEGLVVHIEENIAPETYPESFTSPVPALFVVETVAGFVAKNNIKIGDDFVVLE